MEIDGYIPDQFFRKRDIRFKDKERFTRKKSKCFKREDFKYDSKNDCVICPHGNKLSLSKQTIKMKNFTYKKYFGKKLSAQYALIGINV
jgi:hypothetical protein